MYLLHIKNWTRWLIQEGIFTKVSNLSETDIMSLLVNKTLEGCWHWPIGLLKKGWFGNEYDVWCIYWSLYILVKYYTKFNYIYFNQLYGCSPNFMSKPKILKLAMCFKPSSLYTIQKTPKKFSFKKKGPQEMITNIKKGPQLRKILRRCSQRFQFFRN